MATDLTSMRDTRWELGVNVAADLGKLVTEVF
jgi:hypothetical protein